MITVKHVNDTELPPFRNDDSAEIVLTKDGTLYAHGTRDHWTTFDLHYGRDVAWYLINEMKSECINELLDTIEPLAADLYENMETYFDNSSNNEIGYLTDDGQDLYDEITTIVEKYNNDDDNRLSGSHWYDWFVNDECPSAIRDIINSGEMYSDGIYIYEDSDEAYEESMSHLIDSVKTYTYEQASEAIVYTYRCYKTDGYKSEFWTEFIPKLLEYNDILTVNNHKLYYDDEEIILN